MDAKAIEAAGKLLEPLFKKLGELGAAGFELMVRQNYVNAVVCVVWIIALITFVFIVRSGHKKIAAAFHLSLSGELPENVRPADAIFDYRSDRIGWYWVTAIIRWMITFFLIMAILNYTEALAGRLINPNYYALKDTIELIQPKTDK